jgi:hypothetical protein
MPWQYPAEAGEEYTQWPDTESAEQVPLKQKPGTLQSAFTKQGSKPGLFKQKCGGEWPG